MTNKIQVYPNPVFDHVIGKKLTSGLKDTFCFFFDFKGTLLHKILMTGTETSIPAGNLTNGIYYLKFISDGRNFQTEVIIKR